MVVRGRRSNTELCTYGREYSLLVGYALCNGQLTALQVQGDVLVLYVYQLRKDAEGNENVAVEKVSFRKNGGGAA